MAEDDVLDAISCNEGEHGIGAAHLQMDAMLSDPPLSGHATGDENNLCPSRRWTDHLHSDTEPGNRDVELEDASMGVDARQHIARGVGT